MTKPEGLPLESTCCNCLVSLGVASYVASFDVSSPRLSVSQGLQLVFNTTSVRAKKDHFLKLCLLCGAILEKLLRNHLEFTRLSARGSYVEGLRKHLSNAKQELELNEFECHIKQEREESAELNHLGEEVEAFVVKCEPLLRRSLRRSRRMSNGTGREDSKLDFPSDDYISNEVQ